MKAGTARLEAASGRVLTMNAVSLGETASSHTGIQVDSIRFTQNSAVRTFVEHGMVFQVRRADGARLYKTAALGLP